MLTLPQLPTERPLAERVARFVARGMAALLAAAALLTLPTGVARAVARALTTGGTTLSPLDPLQVNRVQLGNDRTVLFVLGGTAVTSHATRPGRYTARVTLLLSNPGT